MTGFAQVKGQVSDPQISVPGKSPLAMTTQLAAEFPSVRTIIYSGYNDPDFIARAKDAGAWGYVSKNDEPDVILRAVLEVAAGNAWWPAPPRRTTTSSRPA